MFEGQGTVSVQNRAPLRFSSWKMFRSRRGSKSLMVFLSPYIIEKNSSVNKEIRKKEKKRKKKHKLPLFFSRADLIRTPNI